MAIVDLVESDPRRLESYGLSRTDTKEFIVAILDQLYALEGAIKEQTKLMKKLDAKLESIKENTYPA